LRRDPVLAVGAVKIAAKHAEGQRIGTRQHMEEGLLLDRVALQGADIAPRHAQGAAIVEAHLANAAASRSDQAAVAAGVALAGPVFPPPYQLPLDGVCVEDVAQRGHALTPRALYRGRSTSRKYNHLPLPCRPSLPTFGSLPRASSARSSGWR